MLLPPSSSPPPPYLSLSPLPKEEQESTIEIIELDEPLELFNLHHSVSTFEAHANSSITLIVPSMLMQHISLLCSALTFVNEQHLAQTSLNEPRLAPTIGLNEQNIFVQTESAPIESTESISTLARAVSIEPSNLPEIVPPIVHRLCTQLIFGNHSLLYNVNGYVVSQTTLISARLQSVALLNLHNHVGRNA